MSRERELIKRATEALKFWMDETAHSVDWELLEDLESYLSISEPEQDDEPVAHIRKDQLEKASRSAMLCEVSPEPRQDRVGLFLHPAPRPEFVRLSEEELRSCFTETNEAEPLAEGWPGLERFAQAIEHALEEKNR